MDYSGLIIKKNVYEWGCYSDTHKKLTEQERFTSPDELASALKARASQSDKTAFCMKAGVCTFPDVPAGKEKEAKDLLTKAGYNLYLISPGDALALTYIQAQGKVSSAGVICFDEMLYGSLVMNSRIFSAQSYFDSVASQRYNFSTGVPKSSQTVGELISETALSSILAQSKTDLTGLLNDFAKSNLSADHPFRRFHEIILYVLSNISYSFDPAVMVLYGKLFTGCSDDIFRKVWAEPAVAKVTSDNPHIDYRRSELTSGQLLTAAPAAVFRYVSRGYADGVADDYPDDGLSGYVACFLWSADRKNQSAHHSDCILYAAGAKSVFFAWVARLDWMIASRVFQGLLFPAIFTALTTYISSKSNTLHTARNIRQYIFCTIIGGFTGRFFSGWFATLYGWTFFFNFSGALLLASIPGILYLEGNTARAKERFSFTSVRTTLADPLKLNIYLMIFSGFFVFTAVINYIPFRIREIVPDASPQMIAVAYLGYLGGLISLLSAPLLRRTPRITEKILIPASVLGSLCGLAGLFMPFYALIGIFTLLFCASFFMLHGLSSGYINQISQIHKGTANGLYIAFYYSGGTLGSILPGFIYRWADWTWFITALLAVTVFQFYLSFRLSHRISP
ncbi:hypothetical protein CHS0354_002010 [Potamilus streckersoni]|uniref:Major facilitator superfamily (MFS) profile domain-containing protein n=1 Tax=Potamilus streckersoni TaxID=2493646 RepID=A0AAE0W8D7_9BIVA|nr:hypothetical protein CHS0354_002010 [Potamilus streckersoni]